MSPPLHRLAAEVQLAAPENERLRLRFGQACVERVRHFLEAPQALRCLVGLEDYLAGRIVDCLARLAGHPARRPVPSGQELGGVIG